MVLRRSTLLPAALVAATLLLAGLPGLALSPASAGSPATWTPRPADYPGTVTRKDLPIPMSDGTVLRADLTLPADAEGRAVPGRWPVVVTITAYNKSMQSAPGASSLLGSAPAYLVTRGYAQVTVDARGTGSSEGVWCAFCTRENADAGEVMTWAAAQPWSNGSTAMSGPSYMGIDQIFAAATRPPGLKAIFPQVPAADVYRDVVASGGQVDVGFIPLWLGLVTGAGILPPAVTATDPGSGFTALAQHLSTLGTFTAPMLLDAMGGREQAYDGEFYAQRSPVTVVDRVQVPTFLVAGEYDLFQRGTPLLFERLQDHGVPVKMVIGPWNHLQASAGDGFADAGHGTLEEMQLRWFDHWVKGLPDPGLDRIAPITYFEQGSDAWRTANRWMDPADTRATVLPLAGAARPGAPGTLGAAPAGQDAATVLPIPVSGLCSRSADQWTAGLLSQLQLLNGTCVEDNRVNDAFATLFETPPATRTMPILGPINAHLEVSSTSGDGMLSVALSDVAPDGSVTRLTGGWQVVSLRQLDTARSRYVDGQLVQPYHPFTRASVAAAAPGEVVPVDVEIFPTGAAIQPGHRLRMSVQAFDVPHLAPTLPELPGSLSVLTIHSSPEHPSTLVVPTRDRPVPAAGPGAGPGAGPTTGATAPVSAVGPAATTASTRPAVRLRIRGHRLVVRLSGAAGGRVRVRLDGRVVATRKAHDGRVVIRLPQARAGRHTVRAAWLAAGRPVARARAVWRVR